MLLKDYLKAPCSLLSIPYWKQKRITLPPHMKIVHQRDFSPAAVEGYRDQVYFRLLHDLKAMPVPVPAGFLLEHISPEDAILIAAIINASYPDIRVREEQIRAMKNSPAFYPELWVLVRQEETGLAAGCAMGEFDPESGEMSIEWVQVLPGFRRMGLGKALVSELLRRAPTGARFATVSGQADNKSNPEGLYRRCGFAGTDYWHILTKEN